MSLVSQLSIAESLALGQWPTVAGRIDRKAMRRRAGDLLERVGLEVDPDTLVRRLPRSMQQLVEIAKAVDRDASVVTFDEPTASLTKRESERLFAVIENLRDEGRCHRVHHASARGDCTNR